MKISIALLAFATTATAFAPSTPSFGVSTSVAAPARPAFVLAAGGDDDEEEGFDLNLEEMFDM